MAHGYDSALDAFRNALTPRALPADFPEVWVWTGSDFMPDASDEALKRIAAAVVPDTKGVEYMAVKKASNADVVAIKGHALLEKARIATAKAMMAPLPELPEARGNDPAAFGKLAISQHVLKQLVLLKDFCAVTSELGSLVKENGKRFTADFSCNPKLGVTCIVV